MDTPKLVILGTSAGHASAHRASSSYLFDLGGNGVLIDCGDGSTRNFLHAGYRPEWVTDILISHSDPDHWCGLPYFVVQRHLSRTTLPLTIHCPAEAISTFEAMFIMGNLLPEKLQFEIAYDALEAGRALQLNGAFLTPHPTTHLARLRELAEEHGHPNRGECFAMHVIVGDIGILYSADVGSLDDLRSVPDPIDWLLVETSHINLNQLWPWATARGIKRVILTHLSDSFDPAVVIEAQKHTTAEVLIAQDEMALAIGP